MNTLNEELGHETLVLLIPWYVNQTLPEEYLLKMMGHLDECSLCKQELVYQRHLAQAINQDKRFTAQKSGNFAVFRKRLAVSQPQPTAEVLEFTAKPLRRRIELKMFSIAASMLLVIGAGYVVRAVFMPTQQYHTFSKSEVVVARESHLKVVFANHLSQQEINTILAGYGASVTKGPNENAVYEIAFAEEIDRGQVLKKLMLLRHHKDIVFAEPTYNVITAAQETKK